jgi:hypothetical protein
VLVTPPMSVRRPKFTLGKSSVWKLTLSVRGLLIAKGVGLGSETSSWHIFVAPPGDFTMA